MLKTFQPSVHSYPNRLKRSSDMFPSCVKPYISLGKTLIPMRTTCVLDTLQVGKHTATQFFLDRLTRQHRRMGWFLAFTCILQDRFNGPQPFKWYMQRMHTLRDRRARPVAERIPIACCASSKHIGSPSQRWLFEFTGLIICQTCRSKMDQWCGSESLRTIGNVLRATSALQHEGLARIRFDGDWSRV